MLVSMLTSRSADSNELFHYSPRSVWVERRYSSYSFSTSVLDGMSGQRHAPEAFYAREKDHQYPLYRRMGGPQSRSGYRGYRKIAFVSAGDRTSMARSPTRSQTL
jgi:hypothetical protein